MIRGIGPAYAKKLLRAFGEKVFDIIEATPDRLREVDGIGPVRASRITAAWAEQKAVREIMVFLHSHGVGTARAVRIYKTYGPGAIQVMTENPYRLAAFAFNEGERPTLAVIKPVALRLLIGRVDNQAVYGFAFHHASPMIFKLSMPRSSMIFTPARLWWHFRG